MKTFKYLLDILSVYAIIHSCNPAVADSSSIGSGSGNLSFTVDSFCYIDADRTPINFGTVKYTGDGTVTINPDGTTNLTGGVTEITGFNPGTVTLVCSDNTIRSAVVGTYNGSVRYLHLESEDEVKSVKVQSTEVSPVSEGSKQFNIGAKLTIAKNAVPGTYKGYVGVFIRFI